MHTKKLFRKNINKLFKIYMYKKRIILYLFKENIPFCKTPLPELVINKFRVACRNYVNFKPRKLLHERKSANVMTHSINLKYFS